MICLLPQKSLRCLFRIEPVERTYPDELEVFLSKSIRDQGPGSAKESGTADQRDTTVNTDQIIVSGLKEGREISVGSLPGR